MKLIAVDIGNSAIKLVVCDGDKTSERQRWESVDDLAGDLNLPGGGWIWSVCSTKPKTCVELKDWVLQNRPNDHFLEIQSSDILVKTDVESQKSIGRDRLVTAWMALQMFGVGQDIVVVDAGTAVTIDKVDSAGCYQGGVIFPGAISCLKSLSVATGDLPNIAGREKDLDAIMAAVIGKNTELAILRGVYHSQLAAFNIIVESISDDSCVVATGGGVEFLKSYLPDSWNIEPLLVLQGVCRIGKQLTETRRRKN